MKIGILTYHRAHNYGAYLQACALCGRLNMEDDIDAEIIDYCMFRERKEYSVKSFKLKRKAGSIIRGVYRYYREMEETFYSALDDPVMKRSADSLMSDSIEEFSGFVKGKYDIIIAGSDEIWKADSYRGFPTPYWLIGDLGCKKVSYAASARVDFGKVLSPDDLKLLSSALGQFDYIGVRDRQTQEQIRKFVPGGREIHLNCDPSFIFDFNVEPRPIEHFIGNSRQYDPAKKNVVVMLNNNSVIDAVQSSLKGKYNTVFVYKFHKDGINLPGLKPTQWLSLLSSADFVITSMFHGVCFCMALNRPFLALGSDRRKSSKIRELFPDPEKESRYIEGKDFASVDFPEMVERLCEVPDYSESVKEKREGFRDFLESLRAVHKN